MSSPRVPFIQTPDLPRRHGIAINQVLNKTDPVSYTGGIYTLTAAFVVVGDTDIDGNLNLDTGKVFEVNGTQVLGARITGWSADTGTDKRTANATYTAGATLTFTDPPTSAEMTALATRIAAIETAVQNASRTQKSLKADFFTQGIIGT